MNIADYIVDVLTHAGVKQIFGIPGSEVNPMFEALRKQDAVELYVVDHEEIGAFAASAQSKLTGKLGVCMACQGPGAIHLINGLYDALLDRTPVLAITGAWDTDELNVQVVQDIDQIALFNACTIYNREARSPENLQQALQIAIQTAIGEQGPVHISVPMDIFTSPAPKRKYNPNSVFYPDYHPLPAQQAINDAAELINSNNKITILYGNGSRGAADELVALSEKLKAPLVHTIRSKDVLDNKHEHYMGGIGFMGAASGNASIQGCELLLMVGSNFGFKAFYPKGDVPIIQIEHDPGHIGLHTIVTQALVGDAKPTLQMLLDKVDEKTDSSFLNAMQKQHQKTVKKLRKSEKTGKGPVSPQLLTEKINQFLTEDAIVCPDAGLEILWSNNFLHLNGKQRFIYCANLGSLDCSLGMAVGCQTAEKDKQVVILTGDGGFNMMIGAISEMVRYKLPIKIIVYNNAIYEFIKVVENINEGVPNFGVQLTKVDFAKIAEGYGATGFTIKNDSELDDTLAKAFATEGPVIVNVATDPNAAPIPSAPVTMSQAYHFLRSEIMNYLGHNAEKV